MQSLSGKIAAVTGGASGLGRAMALAFAREGMHVAIADVDAASLEHVAGELRAAGVRAHAARFDVSKADQVERWAGEVPDGFAFVCRGATCDVPADDIITMVGQIEGLRR